MKSLIYKLLLVATCLVISTSAFAAPLVDGFLDDNNYTYSRNDISWYNGHKQSGSKFLNGDDSLKTSIYWEIDDNDLYLYLEAPLEAKNMIWGTGVTTGEALLYFQQWDTHHDLKAGEDIEDFRLKLDFKMMTGSEKVIFGHGPTEVKDGGYVFKTKDSLFGGVEADLNGDIKENFYGSIESYSDSVDYVLSADGLGQTELSSNAESTPMSFEFLFTFTSEDLYKMDMLIEDIVANGLEFHLSPERGGTPVPEPTTIALLGIGLAGLAGAEVRRRRKRKAVDKS